MTRLSLTVILMISIIASVRGAEMLKYHGDICGAVVEFSYDPHFVAPAVLRPAVASADLKQAGAMEEFAILSYEYREPWHPSPEGSVFVEARVMRRSERQRREHLVFSDPNALMESMKVAAPGFAYVRREQNGVFWVERVKAADEEKGFGGIREWLIGISADELILFRVSIHMSGKPKTGEKTAWFAEAANLSTRIMESVMVMPERQP